MFVNLLVSQTRSILKQIQSNNFSMNKNITILIEFDGDRVLILFVVIGNTCNKFKSGFLIRSSENFLILH